jgi:hypothetical protein
MERPGTTGVFADSTKAGDVGSSDIVSPERGALDPPDVRRLPVAGRAWFVLSVDGPVDFAIAEGGVSGRLRLVEPAGVLLPDFRLGVELIPSNFLKASSVSASISLNFDVTLVRVLGASDN